jgi:hypothetical protein
MAIIRSATSVAIIGLGLFLSAAWAAFLGYEAFELAMAFI